MHLIDLIRAASKGNPIDPLPTPAEARRLREAGGLTAQQLATICECSTRSVLAYERGEGHGFHRPNQRLAYGRLLRHISEQAAA